MRRSSFINLTNTLVLGLREMDDDGLIIATKVKVLTDGISVEITAF